MASLSYARQLTVWPSKVLNRLKSITDSYQVFLRAIPDTPQTLQLLLFKPAYLSFVVMTSFPQAAKPEIHSRGLALVRHMSTPNAGTRAPPPLFRNTMTIVILPPNMIVRMIAAIKVVMMAVPFAYIMGCSHVTGAQRISMDDEDDAVPVVSMAIMLVSFAGFQPFLLQTTSFAVSEILLPGFLKLSEWIVGFHARYRCPVLLRYRDRSSHISHSRSHPSQEPTAEISRDVWS